MDQAARNITVIPARKRSFRREMEETPKIREICHGLEADGILTGAYMKKWHPETVHKMLKNEKYMGDALLQKTYTTDFLTKKKVVNNGIAPQYYVENSHEAIIPKELFMMTQEEMKRRANLNSAFDGKKRIYSSKYALSGIVICAHCENIFRRIKWNNNGCRSTVWRCVSRVLKKTSNIDCPARTIREEELHETVIKAVNKVFDLDDAFFHKYRKGLETALGANSNKKVREIDRRLSEKQKELIMLSESDGKYDSVASEIFALRGEKQDALTHTVAHSIKLQRVDELMSFVKKTDMKIREYDESLVRKFIEKILVYDEHYIVILKSGIEVEIEG